MLFTQFYLSEFVTDHVEPGNNHRVGSETLQKLSMDAWWVQSEGPNNPAGGLRSVIAFRLNLELQDSRCNYERTMLSLSCKLVLML